MVTQKIKLNLIPGGIMPRIKASQYDTGARTLVFKLYNGSQEFEIPSESMVSIRGTKSDRTGFQYECAYSGSEVTAQITDQMTVSPGEVLAELVITKDDERIATGNFIFDNEEAALKDDTIISETDIPVIERLDNIVVLVEEDAEKAEDAADRAETALVQIRDSVERAAASETAADTSATNAAASEINAAASETAAATSAINAATSESNASASETAAAGSATSASTSAENAAASEINAAASETLARKWAVGDSGSGTNVPSDTNNSFYWAQVAQRAAGGGLTIEVVAALPTTDISVTKIYLVPSQDPESQNVKDEYINLDGTTSGWELIGSTAIDLSGYYTQEEVDTLIQGVRDYADGKLAELKTYVQENYTPTTLYEEEIHGVNLFPDKIVNEGDFGITWKYDGYKWTANGTSTDYSFVNVSSRTDPMGVKLKAGQAYKLSGAPNVNNCFVTVAWIENGKTISLRQFYPNELYIPAKSFDRIVTLQIGMFANTTVSNAVWYPMLRKATIEDSTYRPYNPQAVQNQLNDKGVLGAKNLLPIILSTRTANGVTVTVNKDSSGDVLSVVLNGTATSSGQFNLNNTSGLLNSLLQKYGDLIWSGCPSRTDCRMYTHILNGSYVTLTNNEEKILSASNNYDTNILVQYDNGVTYNNVAFYPMLRLASDPNDTYQPYAMTNRELTKEITEISTKLTTIKATYDEDTALYAHAVGDIVYVNEHFYKVTAAIAVGDTIEDEVNVTSETGLAVDIPIFVSNLPVVVGDS